MQASCAASNDRSPGPAVTSPPPTVGLHVARQYLDEWCVAIYLV